MDLRKMEKLCIKKRLQRRKKILEKKYIQFVEKRKNMPSSCFKKNEICDNADNTASEKEAIRSPVIQSNLDSEYICGENDFSASTSENENAVKKIASHHYLFIFLKRKN